MPRLLLPRTLREDEENDDDNNNNKQSLLFLSRIFCLTKTHQLFRAIFFSPLCFPRENCRREHRARFWTRGEHVVVVYSSARRAGELFLPLSSTRKARRDVEIIVVVVIFIIIIIIAQPSGGVAA